MKPGFFINLINYAAAPLKDLEKKKVSFNKKADQCVTFSGFPINFDLPASPILGRRMNVVIDLSPRSIYCILHSVPRNNNKKKNPHTSTSTYT